MLLSTPPAVLHQTETDLLGQDDALAAWQAWATPGPGASLSEHLHTRHAALVEAVTAWQDEAQELADAAAERWQPYAIRLAAWVGDYTRPQ